MQRSRVRSKVTKMELALRDKSRQELPPIRTQNLQKLLKEKKVRRKNKSLRSIIIRFRT